MYEEWEEPTNKAERGRNSGTQLVLIFEHIIRSHAANPTRAMPESD
jgi:hypothetical protein